MNFNHRIKPCYEYILSPMATNTRHLYRLSIFNAKEKKMNDLNSILIEGNLAQEPKYRTTPRGTPLCTFPIATNRFYRQDEGTEKETSFFNIEAWAKHADICNNHGKKGRGVRIVGRLKQDRWQDSEGKAQSKIVIIAEHVEFRPEFRKNRPADEEAETAESAETEESLVPTF